jgi:cytochrome bd-type quinol oxidase subunit 2
MEAMMGYYKAATAQNTKSDTESNVQNHSLIGLVTFLLISICAFTFKDFNLFEAASESVRQILGYPPPAYLISVALAVYAFSSAILTLTAMANDAKPTQKWNHLGYRSAFFIFYCFSGTIAANFLPVLMVGLALYGLDQFHIGIYNAKINHEGKGLLGKS